MDYERIVQYYETDKMGIVHHSNYIRYFEEARTYFMDKSGINYADMESQGIMLPVVEVNCRYKVGAKYGDTIVVKTHISKCSGITLDFEYTILNRDTGKVCVTGTSSHCFVGSDFKPVKLQKTAPQLYEKIKAIAELPQ